MGQIDDAELSAMAELLFEDVSADAKSMDTKLQDIIRSLELLGLQFNRPCSDVGSSSVDGMSTVVNPAAAGGVFDRLGQLTGRTAAGRGTVQNPRLRQKVRRLTCRNWREAYEQDMNWY